MNRQNILLLNLNHIGDILFTTPAIRALAEKYPDARITAVVLKGMEDMLRHNPYVDEVLTRRRGLADIVKLIPKARARRPGMSVLFTFSSVRMAALGKLSGAPVRVGFGEPGLERFLTHSVERKPGVHSVDWFLDLARALGAEPHNPRMEMYFSDDDRAFADDLLNSVGVSADRPLVALNPGASVPANRWFPERFAALADKLADDGVQVLLLGSPGDRAIVDEVLAAARSNPIDLTGRTRVTQLAALMTRCRTVVSNDTGPMHLSVSVGTPVVAIFGPADPRVTGPYCSRSIVLWDKMDCGPCGHEPKCDERLCLQSITVEQAFEAVNRLISARTDA